MDWKHKAREAVFAAAYSADPEAVPTYLMPKHKPWWAFWRKTEWETITGVSRAQLARAHGVPLTGLSLLPVSNRLF